MKIRSFLIIGVALAFAGISLSAQTTTKPSATTPSTANPATTDAATTDASALSGTFRNIALGSGMASVKELLLADSVFGYRGERDVSLLPGENRTLIETSGLAYIKRAWFQFLEDKLYIMTFSLDPDKVDYYSIYTHLVEKYGEPVSLDPRKAVWEGEGVTLSLERPLTVKYVDSETFASLLEKDTTGKAASEISREGFINEF
jgi:hypothetical protein